MEKVRNRIMRRARAIFLMAYGLLLMNSVFVLVYAGLLFASTWGGIIGALVAAVFASYKWIFPISIIYMINYMIEYEEYYEESKERARQYRQSNKATGIPLDKLKEFRKALYEEFLRSSSEEEFLEETFRSNKIGE